MGDGRFDFDLFTLGAGSGGVASSRRSGAYGARVAICEDSRVGGTCVIRGCVPKKILVYGSHFAHDFSDAPAFGWTQAEHSLDWATLIQAKNREIDRLNGVYLRLLRDSGVTLIEGRGKIVDPHTVEVAGKRYTAEHILVATGGRPQKPPIVGADLGITSNEALDLPKLPKHVVVVGGGYIGVEFAGIFRAAGAKVTMLIRGDTVLRGFDADIRAALTSELRKSGIDVRCETFVADVERRGDGRSVLTQSGETIECDVVLFATGRVPNTENLGLEEVGVSIDKNRAIAVDAYSRTNVSSIFAVGDCTNRINLTPVAIAEGRAVAETLFRNSPTAIDHEGVPSAVFSQPPVATVGLSEERARREHGDLDVYVTNFRPLKHTITGREERTMMKLVVARESRRVLGVHMVGADAPEIVQGFAVALKCGATKEQFDKTVGIHPSAAEEFVTMRDKRPDAVHGVGAPGAR
ncbi:MAG: glutathione-disulfide reductase [Polyangiaceae bacterium]|nr:glutathione-disulfide reductase [Polyangiaceae bacterium]